MGGETLFRQTVRTASANMGLGCLGAAAGIPALVVVMNLVLLATGQAMSDSLETFVHVSIPVGLVLAVAFGIATFRVAKSTARELELRRVDGSLVLTISPDVELVGPFEVTVGWDRSPGGRGVKLLWCDVARGDELLCALSQEIGSLLSTPDGWPRQPPAANRVPRHGGYAVGNLAELARRLRDDAG